MLGFIGPGSIVPHVEHANAMAEVVGDAPDWFADLGSGGGIPGLVLLSRWPNSAGLLVEAMHKRAEFLRSAAKALEWSSRTTVYESRAEAAGRNLELREQLDLVVSRSFGPPAVTAECSAGLLRVGGSLVVSEPPETEGERWPAPGLQEFGLELEAIVAQDDHHFAKIRKIAAINDRYPRRDGIPAKRPIWQ
jgi:16S rRNA (guanine527-N7)-methyltransferase